VDSLAERVDRERLLQRAAVAPLGEALGGLDSELTREERVVSELGVGVEREV
jgi:hypothetical protein